MGEHSGLDQILDIVIDSDMPEQECDSDKFEVVFRRLVQEHIADRIFSRASEADTFDLAVDIALETASTWFGPRKENNWPFTQQWLKDYIVGRYHGKRSGTYIQDQEGNARSKFLDANPQSAANCNWFLGCNESNDLQVDHVVPSSLHGENTVSNYQYLCKNHNLRWKGNLLFWDVEIPMPVTE